MIEFQANLAPWLSTFCPPYRSVSTSQCYRELTRLCGEGLGSVVKSPTGSSAFGGDGLSWWAVLIRIPIENCARQASEVFETSEVSAFPNAQLFAGMRMIGLFRIFGPIVVLRNVERVYQAAEMALAI